MRYLILHHKFDNTWDFYKEQPNGNMLLCTRYYNSLQELAIDELNNNATFTTHDDDSKWDFSFEDCIAHQGTENTIVATHKQLHLLAL